MFIAFIEKVHVYQTVLLLKVTAKYLSKLSTAVEKKKYQMRTAREKKKTQISVKNILKKFKNGTLFIHSRKHGAVFG